jgi:hypothetical protein
MSSSISITDYAPRRDGVTDDTEAFLQGFTAAAEAGGGVITIPAGDYRLNGERAIPLCSGLTVLAQGARFHLPESLGNQPHRVLFEGTDICDFQWQGGHFEGHCFDLRRTDNIWEPNACTKAIAIATSPEGETRNLRFAGITGHRVGGAVVTVRGVADHMASVVDRFATGIDVRDCHLVDCGKFMWDYGLLWQILVWPEEYSDVEVEMAWRYFRQDLVRRPIGMADGDDRVRFDNGCSPVAAGTSEAASETICFFGDALPRNVARGIPYHVVESAADYIRVSETPGGTPIRFDGAAGPEAGLITDLPQAFYHLFQPIDCGQGKGAVDLVACQQTIQTGNRLSALGDTHHLLQCHDNVFANNQITGSRMGAFFIAEYCRNTTVNGNTVDGTNGSRIMSVEKSNEDVTITGNTFRGGGRGSWINQPKNFILQGNVFVNNTTKGESNPRRGRRSFKTGEYERFPELYFTLHQPGGDYGPAIIRDNIFVTGPEARGAIDFGPNGHDLVVEGNVFEGPARTVRVDPSCERVRMGHNPGMVEEAQGGDAR